MGYVGNKYNHKATEVLLRISCFFNESNCRADYLHGAFAFTNMSLPNNNEDGLHELILYKK